MASYYPVYPKFWVTARLRGWDERTTNLGLYVLTCEHRNLEGYYRLPKAYIAADRGWSAGQVDAALAALERDGFVQYDESTEVLFVCNALEHQAPKSERQVEGAIRSLATVPDSALWRGFLAAAALHAPALAERLPGYPFDTHSNGSTAGSADPADTHSNLACADNSTSNSTSRHNSNSTPKVVDPDRIDRAREKHEQGQQVFTTWVSATERDQAKTLLTTERRRIIEKALKSHGLADCLAAVTNIGADDWARGNNDRGRRFDDIQHALGSAERIERWRDQAPRRAGQPSVPAPLPDRFSKYDQAAQAKGAA